MAQTEETPVARGNASRPRSPEGNGSRPRSPEGRPASLEEARKKKVRRPSSLATLFGFPRPGKQSDAKEFGQLIFTRISTRVGEQTLMGKVKRSPVTGMIHLRNRVDFPDFQIVDVSTRMYLLGSIGSHAKDIYLFRPVPLGYRTWMYHRHFRRHQPMDDEGGNAMIQQALSHWCIDAPISAGRWSPIMSHGPMALALSFMGDLYLMSIATLHLAFLCSINLCMNTPELYRHTRWVTVPERVLFLGVILWRYLAMENVRMLATVGLVVALLVYCLDVFYGDLDMLRHYRHHCRYEILRVLPNRLLVCKKHGAEHYEEDFGVKPPVPQEVTGAGEWNDHFMLIADLYGILVELRPLTEDEWRTIGEDRDRGRRTYWKFAGLDVYNEKVTSTKDLDLDPARPGVRRTPKAAAGEAVEDVTAGSPQAANGVTAITPQARRRGSTDVRMENL